MQQSFVEVLIFCLLESWQATKNKKMDMLNLASEFRDLALKYMYARIQSHVDTHGLDQSMTE